METCGSGESASWVRRKVGRAAGVLSGDGGSECSFGTGKGGRKSGMWPSALHSVRGRFLDGDDGIDTGDGGSIGESCRSGLEGAGSTDMGSSSMAISVSDSPDLASSSELGGVSGSGA